MGSGEVIIFLLALFPWCFIKVTMLDLAVFTGLRKWFTSCPSFCGSFSFLLFVDCVSTESSMIHSPVMMGQVRIQDGGSKNQSIKQRLKFLSLHRPYLEMRGTDTDRQGSTIMQSLQSRLTDNPDSHGHVPFIRDSHRQSQRDKDSHRQPQTVTERNRQPQTD